MRALEPNQVVFHASGAVVYNSKVPRHRYWRHQSATNGNLDVVRHRQFLLCAKNYHLGFATVKHQDCDSSRRRRRHASYTGACVTHMPGHMYPVEIGCIAVCRRRTDES